MKVSDFSKEVPFTPEFNGNKALDEKDQLRFTLKPMPLGELLAFTEIMQDNQVKEGEPADPQKMTAGVAALGKFLPNYAKITQGNDGFDMNDVVNYAQFMPLCNELAGKLIAISQPNKADEKN